MSPLGRIRSRIALRLLALSLIASVAAAVAVPAQSSRPVPVRTPSARAIPNSTEGLRELLASLLAAAKSADPGKLDALVVSLEIPDYRQWFVRTFGEDRGESDSDLYSRTLDQSENELEKEFRQIAAQSRDFQIRKVNDAPRGPESEMLARFREHADVYFVSWVPKAPKAKALEGSPGSSDADSFPYPYFVFIGGKFRWDALQRIPLSEEAQPVGAPQISESNVPRRSAIPQPIQPLYQPAIPPTPSAPQSESGQRARQAPNAPTGAPAVYVPGKNGVGYPSCLVCPSPVYPASAKSGNLEGDVVLKATIGEDGQASNIALVSTDDLIFNEYAIAAVRNWRFKPAPGPDGKPVPVVTEIDVQFRLPHP